jgi:hypothetical protein
MIGHLAVEAQTAKPAVRQVQVDFFAKPSFRADAEAIADDQHPDQQLRIDLENRIEQQRSGHRRSTRVGLGSTPAVRRVPRMPGIGAEASSPKNLTKVGSPASCGHSVVHHSGRCVTDMTENQAGSTCAQRQQCGCIND